MTSGSNGPVLVHDIADNPQFCGHPAYRKFQLGAYIGIPLYLNDELYGTLNFSSVQPKKQAFHSDDGELLKLMALWVEGELLRHQQQQQLVALNEQLEIQARSDLLTGLPNRRGLFEQLESDFSQQIKKGGEGTLMLMDLDHFKAINDTYGHQRGDGVLRDVAQAVKDAVKDKGLLARFGGEEFILWLKGGDYELRLELVRKVTEAVSLVCLDGKPVTTSGGACHFTLEGGQKIDAMQMADTLIAKADSALYRAKDAGRNRVIHCHQEFQQ
jgi:diguanylate cyclase (GGDEF)-like protein